VVESKQDAPLLDLSLFRNPTFSGANADALLIMLAMLSFLFFGSLYLRPSSGTRRSRRVRASCRRRC
jgi:hypothetical protein